MRTIPELKEGTHRAKASGTLPNGKPVIVNADGTVSVIEEVTENLGSAVVFDSTAAISNSASVFDSSNNKVIIVYESNASGTVKMEYVVGTVSGSSISFGSVGEVMSSNNRQIDAVFDTNSNRIVVVFGNGGDSNHGYAIVGSLSGTTVTWGSATEFKNAEVINPSITFDSSNNKVVIAYRDQGNSGYGTSVVGTVSGTGISFGTDVVYSSRNAQDYTTLSFDTNANKVVVIYQDSGDTSYGRANVGTVSGTSISWGTVVIFTSSNTWRWESTFDSSNNKVVAVYRDSGDSNKSKAIVGTVSGTSISFGTPVVFSSVESRFEIAFDSNANKVVIISMTTYSSPNVGNVIVGTVSGTDISFTTTQFLTGNSNGEDENDICFDSNANKMVLAYTDGTNSDYGTSKVFTVASTNLTSENYIGMSQGGIVVTSQTQAIGSAVIFEDADTKYTVSTFDSVNNKIIIAYRDNNNSGYLTAIVGTVSGTSISFGTPVVAASNSSQYVGIAFNDNAGKCLISYRNASTQKALAIVGTVSGTSISFGTAAIFNNADTENTVAAYDAASQNVVIAYKDQANSSYGTAIVAVISGTSVSFGSEVVFQSTNSVPTSIVYDSGISKVIIGYKKYDSFFKGFGVVGTVSGNSISFGTPVRFDTANTSGYDVQNISLTYNSNEDKTLFASRSTDGYGQLNVATVSGTSISFAADVTFNSANTSSILSFYDSDAQAHGIAYGDTSDNFKYVTATISGTSATISSPTSISSNIGTLEGTMGAAYDTDSNKGVLAYQIRSPDSRGTTRVIQNASTTITRGQVNAGSSATVDIIGSLSTNQSGLTAGQSYYVQTDGTIGETAADPSVFAGTAISATSLVVKT